VRRIWHRLLCVALAGASFVAATPAEARADEPASIDIKDKPPARLSAPPIKVDPPPARAATWPYSLGILGLGSALVITGGVIAGIASTIHERCGVAGCYDVADRELEFTGKLVLAGGIGMGLVGVTATLVGLATDGKPVPRRSDAFTERGIFVTALGAGLACVALADSITNDLRRQGADDFARNAALGALVTTGLGLGFWIYGGRSAPDPRAASLRVGPTSAHFTVHF
jgi:hypothetical protein